ncbi:MarR family winged helix-turn-helix transcriptional regulator [Pigmentiphaga litoralis]|uniref:DNA-binding MarR family transcriptional regulator n=1 Tax=Pigmentiphaga litoralis TaxID=516702 RepID=A0A7Y9LKD7_9BURK|nr:MarR family transcriptional regulator [Pigmentiphaga litoralis]NYE23542.1 DNA-binding MarR family transcriptional regulator [Pigmentiphaga litoralis]NYE82844.1 DNA-binding MarR family transcriptional regulator [Pigmentiphaga litoralis]
MTSATAHDPSRALARDTLRDASSSDALNEDFLLGLVGHSARLASSSIRPLFVERMAQYDLRQAEFAVLSLLQANPGISQRRLADAINVSPPNMASVLARLVERGLVQRQRDAADQRTQVLALTSAGTLLYRRAAATVATLEREATAVLSDKELAELLRLLRKLSGR